MAKLDLANAKILITGGRGFLGKRLCYLLTKHGCKNITAIGHYDCDLTNQKATFDYFDKEDPALVFHLAALVGGIGANSHHPGKFFYDNIMMGLNVLEACRKFKVAKVVNVGTVCAYPKFTPVPFKEEDLWNGYPEETNAPFGIAKKSLLVMCQGYRSEYGCNFVMVFPTNLYGPGDNFDPDNSHVIPAMIRKFLSAQKEGLKKVIMWGDGSPTREFLYVDDAAKGLIQTAESYNSSLPMNLGSGMEISIKDLAEKIKMVIGYEVEIDWDLPLPNGQPKRMVDATRAKDLIGFTAETSFEDGLKETVEWYRKKNF
jgi:GDP-L-fucose synthase